VLTICKSLTLLPLCCSASAGQKYLLEGQRAKAEGIDSNPNVAFSISYEAGRFAMSSGFFAPQFEHFNLCNFFFRWAISRSGASIDRRLQIGVFGDPLGMQASCAFHDHKTHTAKYGLLALGEEA
jgi:hypothetical protein